MERTTVLRDIAANGFRFAAGEPARTAAELDLPVADVYVPAGRPVPEELLPPERDAKVLKEFGFRAGRLIHEARVELEAYVRELPRLETPGRFPLEHHRGRPPGPGFGTVFGGLLRNRGFGVSTLPFVGLPAAPCAGCSATTRTRRCGRSTSINCEPWQGCWAGDFRISSPWRGIPVRETSGH